MIASASRPASTGSPTRLLRARSLLQRAIGSLGINSVELRPALLIFAFGASVLVLRGPQAVDETRYLEVAREFSFLRPLNLYLNGVPYAHKPPLAFWLAGALRELGFPVEVGLRLLPAVATALTAWVVALLARRLEIRDGAWVYASMLLPVAYSQVLLLDPLLTLAVWWSLLQWSRGNDSLALLGASAAMLSKGPVAAIYLVPFACALAGLRPRPRGPVILVSAAIVLAASALVLTRTLPGLSSMLGADFDVISTLAWTLWGAALIALLATIADRGHSWISNLAVVLLPAALVLIAWALGSALRGGETYARDLLLQQTAGRISNSFAHSRPALFYLPVLLLGALPVVPVALRLSITGTVARLFVAAGVSLGVLMLIDGKQPHYLLPLYPALALGFAWVLQRSAPALRAWKAAALSVLAVLWLAWVGVVPFLFESARERYGAYAVELFGSAAWWLLWALGAAVLLVAALRVWRSSGDVPVVASTFLLGVAAITVPGQYALGRLATPRTLEALLAAEPEARLALYQAFQGGYFNWISQRASAARLENPDELQAWCTSNPGAFVIGPAAENENDAQRVLSGALVDRLRGRPFALRRVAAVQQ